MKSIGALCVVVCLASTIPAHADEVELFARVIVDSTPLRSGPGTSFRRTGIAFRGDTFLVFGGERSATGDGDDVFIWNVAEERLDLFDGGRTKMAFAGKDLTAIRVDIGRFCSAGRVLPLRPRS